MIIEGLSEEKILEELIFDRKIIANEAKKIASKTIARLEKAGQVGIDKDYEEYYTITTGKLHNKWTCLINVNMKKPPFWTHYAACMVESEMGSKDFYHVRGFSKQKPYFIKISSHAVKRFKERGVRERLNTDVDFTAEGTAPIIIRQGEIISWMKITDPRLLKIVFESEDRHHINTLFYTFYGCYLGYETEKGNVEFKTFLNNYKELKKPEENIALYMCRLAHVAYNKKFYSKRYIDELLNDKEYIPDMIGEVLMDYKDKFILYP